MSAHLLGLLNSMNETEIKREDLVKAPFGYPGGKDTALPMILPHLPYTPYYAEPFGGSGVILLARRKVTNEYFNDRASGITDFYRCVKDNALCRKLLEYLDFSVCSREEFNRCRDTWVNTVDPVERAARWYIMVQTSFQRYGRHWGRSLTHKNTFSMILPNALKGFWPVHYRLQGVFIENQDWRQMFNDLNHDQRVWYLDPPYVQDRCNLNGMYEHSMSLTDHHEMCERIFNGLHGYVALSGYDNPLYNSYPWDQKYTWETRMSASASVGTETNNRKGSEGNNDEIRTECLWIKEFSK